MRWKCTCAYDGTNFDGWQRQPGGGAVQNHIEAALTQIFDLPLQLHGSGRTDAGVHARGQCFHFDAEWLHEPEKLIRALHSILPTSIRIKSVKLVSDDFHARFSVSKKRYIYNYYLGRADPVDDPYVWACRDLPLDLKEMQVAADHLLGTHDFSAYSATHGKENDPNPVKTVTRLQLKAARQVYPLRCRGQWLSLPNGTQYCWSTLCRRAWAPNARRHRRNPRVEKANPPYCNGPCKGLVSG
jgi:tRNA pseudouridine38-40 synthase